MDAGCTPEPVFLAHPSNEFAQFATDLRTSRLTARFPTPIGPKPCSMPAKDRIRLNHARQAEQVWPEPCHPDHECSISSAQPETMRSVPHHDIELMTQIQVLDFKPAPRLEPVENQRKDQAEQGKHTVEDAPIPS